MKVEEPTVGICMLSYGTPQARENLIPYMADIRHGRTPTEQEIQWLDARYTAVGQWTDERLRSMSRRQGDVLAKLVAPYPVYRGYLHDDRADAELSSVESAVRQMVDDGIQRAVVIMTAPFHSRLGTGAYRSKFEAAAARFGLDSHILIEEWWTQPEFTEYWTRAVSAVMDRESSPETGESVYIFTAHSLPIMGHGKPCGYADDVYRAAEVIANRSGLTNWKQSWQSAGATGTWLGPSVEETIRVSLDEGARRIVFVPFGFVSDHVEILYDNDIECRRLVEADGAVYDRAVMPNTDERFIQAMAKAVTERIAL